MLGYGTGVNAGASPSYEQGKKQSRIMDNSQYHQQNNSTTSNAQYNPLPGIISPQQLQQATLPPHTLPPLQPQHVPLHPMYSSASHTPRSPSTPNTPGSANTTGTFPQMVTQSRNYQMMPTNNYQPSTQSYRNAAVNMPQSSAPMPQPQPIAPALTQNTIQQPPLRSMPQNSPHLMSAISSPYTPSGLLTQSPILPDIDQPTHVVGSQGRRGILPSAPGRPAVIATATGAVKTAFIAVKNAEGKFPCEYCNKTYLHAKHLKRHNLRHTGARPYICALCGDSFSRSDILKRHFQKCEARRGNPRKLNHLSHAQAHAKKSHPGPHKSPSGVSRENNITGVSSMGALNNNSGLVYGSVAEGNNTVSDMTGEQATSRSNNNLKLENTGSFNNRTVTAQNPTRPRIDQGYVGGMPSLSSAINSAMTYNLPNGQTNAAYTPNFDFSPQPNKSHQMPAQIHDTASQNAGRAPMAVYPGSEPQQDGVDWAHVFQAGAQSTGQGNYMQSYNGVAASQMPSIKGEKSSSMSLSNPQ